MQRQSFEGLGRDGLELHQLERIEPGLDELNRYLGAGGVQLGEGGFFEGPARAPALGDAVKPGEGLHGRDPQLLGGRRAKQHGFGEVADHGFTGFLQELIEISARVL